MSTNALAYPYWNNPQGRLVADAIASQETRRESENRTPLRDDFNHLNAMFTTVPHVVQDSRRAGNADKQINAVTNRAYLYQRVFDSPALAANRNVEE